ncbi:MAG: CopG family transcriptional regulator [Myxococcales bacterium]|nr:CopG family transcriptional regulator [Myxococcales bacterium]
MKMSSIRVPARTRARIARLAKERGVTHAELVRQAIEQLASPTLWERIAPLVGKSGSGRGGLSSSRAHLEGFGK